MSIALFAIDAQNGFCDVHLGFHGDLELPVPGASADMGRLASLVWRYGGQCIDAIVATLDWHDRLHIAHAHMWRNACGMCPAPFTTIKAEDIERDVWIPQRGLTKDVALAYARALEAGGKYRLIIWPEHCLAHTWGAEVYGPLKKAFRGWEQDSGRPVHYVKKGQNRITEHYGAFAAEVPVWCDPSTELNVPLLEMLGRYDAVLVAGEAKSHCLATSVDQFADYLEETYGPDAVRKIVLLSDCTSPVPAVPDGPDYPALAEAWQARMVARGMRVSTCATVFTEELSA